MRTATPAEGGGAKLDIEATGPRDDILCPADRQENPPAVHVGQAADRVVARLRRQRQAEHLHRLGPRPVLEALIEAAETGDLDATLERFGRLDPEVVEALGADEFPPTPIYEVRR